MAQATSLDAALKWLDQSAADMEALLRELVEISSHTPDSEGVTRAAERYEAALAELCRCELTLALHPSQSGRFGSHLVASTRIAQVGHPVLLAGHHDTVFPRAAFAGFLEDGPLLRGPGVLDMKGGLVVIAFALGALAEAGLLERIPVRLVSVADEEVGSPEGRAHILQVARGAACALVFESGRQNDLVITRRKGTAGITVTCHGKSAHAGNFHHEGCNAIWSLARFVDRAQAITDYERGVTVNVGRVEGGIGKNTVPDRAEAQVDFRFISTADGEATLAALEAAARAAAVAGTTVEVAGGILRKPLERTESSARLFAEYAACARASGLGDQEAPLLGGGSDANTCAEVGVAAIDGMGPRGRGFHTNDEYIERATLIPKAAALVRFLAGRMAPTG